MLKDVFSGTDFRIAAFPAGEENKKIETILALFSRLAADRLDRKSLIVAVGGGVTGDMAGFLAAIYLRGIPFVQVPTSLLAVADSSIGGKTGVDTESGARHIVASEVGLKYEDTVIHQRRSDNSSYYMWQPGGSFSTAFITTQLVMGAKELKKKILEYAVRPTPAYNTSHFFKTVQPPAFPGKKPEDLDIKDSIVFEKANPANRKSR